MHIQHTQYSLLYHSNMFGHYCVIFTEILKPTFITNFKIVTAQQARIVYNYKNTN